MYGPFVSNPGIGEYLQVDFKQKIKERAFILW